MTPTEFALVQAAIRIGLGFDTFSGDALGRHRAFRHQVRRLERHLFEVGDRDQAARLQRLLDPPPNPDPDAKVVQS